MLLSIALKRAMKKQKPSGEIEMRNRLQGRGKEFIKVTAEVYMREI